MGIERRVGDGGTPSIGYLKTVNALGLTVPQSLFAR
jgi:hypothetical protein